MRNSQKIPVKTALLHTLEELLHQKPFQKISVNELCESAQISRSAFYANFEDKYQLLSCCLSEKRTALNAAMDRRLPQESLSVVLDFIQTEDRFFYNIFGTDSNEELRELLYRYFHQHLTSVLAEKASNGLSLPGPVDVITDFYIGGLTSIVFRWVKSNYKMPKEELADCLYRLLTDIL